MKLNRILMSAFLAAGAAGAAVSNLASDGAIANKLSREIRMYTRYTIWDNVKAQVTDGQVALTGEVSQPFKKKDLERIARRVPGVESVRNELRVLPLSSFDDDVRIRVARAIYLDPVLSRYAVQVHRPIHIIVDHGTVKLEGVVNNELEKNVAGLRASSAGLSFGPVVNNLKVENSKRRG
jgi:hyperosmotically inducible periplasmic protein